MLSASYPHPTLGEEEESAAFGIGKCGICNYKTGTLMYEKRMEKIHLNRWVLDTDKMRITYG